MNLHRCLKKLLFLEQKYSHLILFCHTWVYLLNYLVFPWVFWVFSSYICALFFSQGKSDHWPYLTLIRSYEGTLGPYSIQAPEEETHPDQSDEDDCSTAGLIAIPAAAATIDQREDVLDEMVVSAHVDSEQPDHQSGGWSEDENVWWNEKFCAEELCVDIFRGTESI